MRLKRNIVSRFILFAMANPLIEKAIKINASPEKVWQVFTNPRLTRQMGGEYITEWKSGGTLAWKGQDGTIQTKGIILELEPERLLKHDLYDPEDENRLLSVITYEFKEDNGKRLFRPVKNSRTI